MKPLAFHSLFRWNMIILPMPTASVTYYRENIAFVRGTDRVNRFTLRQELVCSMPWQQAVFLLGVSFSMSWPRRQRQMFLRGCFPRTCGSLEGLKHHFQKSYKHFAQIELSKPAKCRVSRLSPGEFPCPARVPQNLLGSRHHMFNLLN